MEGYFSYPVGHRTPLHTNAAAPVGQHTPLQPDFDNLSDGDMGNTSAAAIRELASQIGRLTMNMEHMQRDIHDLKGKVSGVPSLPSSGVSKKKDVPEEASSKSDTYECLASGAKVPSKVLKAAINGEFVNLAEFCPILEPSNVTEASLTDGELTFKP